MSIPVTSAYNESREIKSAVTCGTNAYLTCSAKAFHVPDNSLTYNTFYFSTVEDELGFEELEHELHALFTHAECAATSEALERHDVDLPHVFIDAEKHHRAYRCEKTYLCAVGPVTAMRTLYRARPGERAVAAMERKVGIVEG